MKVLSSLLASAVLLASSAAFATTPGNGGPLPSYKTDLREIASKAGFDVGKGSKLVTSPANPKFSGVGSKVTVTAKLYNKSTFNGTPTPGQNKYRLSGQGTFTLGQVEEGPVVLSGSFARDDR